MTDVLNMCVMKYFGKREDVRARLLRNYFVFMIIPMINVDGVSNGHFRMNTFNENLNRFYNNPDPVKQPAIFAIRSLAEYLHSESRIFFYCDLHSHAARKGCFLYGNALDFVMQVIQFYCAGGYVLCLFRPRVCFLLKYFR